MSTYKDPDLVIQEECKKTTDKMYIIGALLVAGMTSGGALLFIPHWGLSGAAITYFVCTGIVGLSFASVIFLKRRAHPDVLKFRRAG